MASEDFVIDIGLRLNDKEARAQASDFYKNQILPLQKRIDKVQRGSHDKLTQDTANIAHQYYKMMGGAVTPAQAVRYAAGGTPTAGTAKRLVVDRAEHELRLILKQEKEAERRKKVQAQEEASLQESLRRLEYREKGPIEKLQDMARGQLEESVVAEAEYKKAQSEQQRKDLEALHKHLGGMEKRGLNPVDKVWQYLDDKKEQAIQRHVSQQLAEIEQQRKDEEHQAKVLEIIAKNTGFLKKWDVYDKAIVQREQRSILSSLKPGEELTDYQQQVLGVGFSSINLKSLATKAIAGLGTAIIPMYRELTREAGMLSKISSMTGYSAQAERALQYAGVQNAYQSMTSLSSFNDRLRLGQVNAEQMQGFAMFGRRTYAQLRANPNDIRAIHAAFAADIADAESRGFTRQTAAQAMGMSDYLPTLSFTPEEMEDFYQKAESAKYQQYRAKGAYMTEMVKEEAKDSVLDLFSKNKAGTVTGMGAGAITGAAIGSIIPGIGTAIGGLIGMGVGALGGGLIGAGVQELASPDSAGVQMNNTVNVHIDRDAMNEILNSGSSTQTFATTATAEPW
jgi:outer membrane lipoprotein SlyB